jgi:hypothetical protein
MLRYNWFRHLFSAIALSSTLLFVASCSEGPAPGPISPINLDSRRLAPKQTSDQSSSNTVRPVQRLVSRSLAKSGYNIAKVQQELQAVCDELAAIVDNRPGKAVEDKLSDVLKEAHGALAKLRRVPPDDRSALYKIDRAKDRLQEAIYKRLLLPAQGEQFINQFAAVEEQIQTGVSPDGDCRGRSKYLWIKRNYGGMIKFGGHSIDVPKYATKQDAEFSISISPNDYITVEFGPDGWFDQPVIVTISYKDADLTAIDPAKLTLAWYDESAGQWIDLGGVVDVVNKTVTAKAWHFTQYTISTK